MRGKPSRLSLGSRSLRYKLMIGFQLMSILPLLISFYLVSNYILPKFGLKLDIIATVIASAFVALVGLLVIKEIFDRLSSVTSEAKLIAAGDISRRLDVEHADEIGDLGNVLNQLTQRIRNNMDELKNYSEKTSAINLEIQKKVMVLSSLMQISSLISEGSSLNDILKMAVEKSRSLANSDTAFLLFRDEPQKSFYIKTADGLNMEYLLGISVEPGEELYQRAFNLNRPLVLDKQILPGENLTVAFYEKFRMKNALTMPVFLKDKIKAVLGIGNNRESFIYTKDDIELLDIFSKQISIAIESSVLSHRLEKLEVKDALTGLYNETYIRSRLQEEIKRAILYQRPCSLILFDIDNFKKYHENFGLIAAESAIKKIATLLKDSVTEIDRVARIGDDEFAVILPERNKRQAQEAAEQMRSKIEFSYSEERESDKKVSVSAGVSENPLDGVEVEQLLVKARELLARAKEQGRNRVVAF